MLYNGNRQAKYKKGQNSMATQIGTVKADNVNVLVSQLFSLVRIYQDADSIVLADISSLHALIEKLQEAEKLIISVKKG